MKVGLLKNKANEVHHKYSLLIIFILDQRLQQFHENIEAVLRKTMQFFHSSEEDPVLVHRCDGIEPMETCAYRVSILLFQKGQDLLEQVGKSLRVVLHAYLLESSFILVLDLFSVNVLKYCLQNIFTNVLFLCTTYVNHIMA